jgi:hypothetical protein
MAKHADRKKHVNEHSRDADLIIMGFSGDHLRRHKGDLFTGYDEVGSILFVSTMQEIEIDRVEDEISIEGKESEKNAEKEKKPTAVRGRPKNSVKSRAEKGKED